MKNNNARINDFLKACERKGYLIFPYSPKSQRTLRQETKRQLSQGIGITLCIKGGCLIHLTLPLDKCKAADLPSALAEDFATLTRQPSRERIETESEIIAGCRLLGASYKGGGKFVTPCGATYKIPLDKPVKAQEVRDAVICDLAWEIKKKPQIGLTQI